jgi:serine/threonine protein kinase
MSDRRICPKCGREMAEGQPDCAFHGAPVRPSGLMVAFPSSGSNPVVVSPRDRTMIRYLPFLDPSRLHDAFSEGDLKYAQDTEQIVFVEQFVSPIPTPGHPVERTGPPGADPADPADAIIGLRLGEYDIRERIGEGGMGIVYRATHAVIGKDVAIKVLRAEIADDAAQISRFLGEARVVNAIRHRGIINIFGFGQIVGGAPYIVMEHLDGLTLGQMIHANAPIPPADVMIILDETLAALGAAHAAGVIHRDVKPSNIFLNWEPDGALFVKVLDFGLAKRGAPGVPAKQTAVTRVVGTPEFMAPEQARGLPITAGTDLYSLGAVAFEMLTGRPPFVGKSGIDVAMQHVEQPPPVPSSLVPGIPGQVDDFVLWLLSKLPEERPANAEEARIHVRRLLDSIREAQAASGKRVPSTLRRDAVRTKAAPVEPTPARDRALDEDQGPTRLIPRRANAPAPDAPTQENDLPGTVSTPRMGTDLSAWSEPRTELVSVSGEPQPNRDTGTDVLPASQSRLWPLLVLLLAAGFLAVFLVVRELSASPP